MASEIEIDGKILSPIKEAAALVSYSRDYVTRLAREEKIVATTIGRQWFVSIDSLQAYVEASAMEQDLRKKQLSADRKREREIREAKDNLNSLHIKKVKTLPVRAAVMASLVLSIGLLGGLVTDQFLSFSEAQQAQIANTGDGIYVSSSLEQSGQLQDESGLATEKEISLPSEPVRNINNLGDINNGVLLLPSAGTSTPEEMFSDDVVVVTLSDGTKAVVQVDEEGNVSGNRVPFVTLPVEPIDI